jgi:hypothetical protein
MGNRSKNNLFWWAFSLIVFLAVAVGVVWPMIRMMQEDGLTPGTRNRPAAEESASQP